MSALSASRVCGRVLAAQQRQLGPCRTAFSSCREATGCDDPNTFPGGRKTADELLANLEAVARGKDRQARGAEVLMWSSFSSTGTSEATQSRVV